MFRKVLDHVWAFDLEWVPDPASGRRVYNLPATMPDTEVIAEMWVRGGATPEEPRPYLKTMLCRVVSVAVVIRKVHPDRISLDLASLPRPGEEAKTERELLSRFLTGLGGATPKPQLVGFNSHEADLTILVQRGIANGLNMPGFCARPDKPWDGLDYFHKNGDGHIDLRDIVSGYGRTRSVSLHEFAAASGVPGKIDMSGDNVVDLWLAGDMRRVVEYNEFDALTTYLMWLRTARFAGLFSEEGYAAEETRVRELIDRRISQGDAHLQRYRDKWAALAGE